MPSLYRIKVVDHIKMVDNTNRKELEMQKSELLWSLSGTHTLRFFLDCHVIAAYNNCLTHEVNVLISHRTDELTDRQTKPIA